MLLGFALAVVAGNQLGAAGTGSVLAILFAWALARAAFLLAPASPLAGALNAAFAALIALHVLPRLFGSAKKLRNRVLPFILGALCAAAAGWQLAPYAHGGTLPADFVVGTVVLFALLMLFMGGRVIAPVVAGQLHRQGERLEARVQPHIEAALIATGLAALFAIVAPVTPLAPALALATTGLLAALRLGRWRLWALRGRPDLLCLGAGYAWLSLGLVALGASLAFGVRRSAALHVITVGALGTLTLNVMAQTWLLKARRGQAGSRAIVAGTLLVAAAALFRVLASFYPEPWLVLAAACWATAFAILLSLFWRTRPWP
jgi:uncharacterized protein involved in response to NO